MVAATTPGMSVFALHRLSLDLSCFCLGAKLQTITIILLRVVYQHFMRYYRKLITQMWAFAHTYVHFL